MTHAHESQTRWLNDRDINETRRQVLGSNFPTGTMVQVVALARPELLLEINVVAVIS